MANEQQPVGAEEMADNVTNIDDAKGVDKDPLEGGVREYNPEAAPSEQRMREMEAAKKDYADQKPFDDYAKSADADKEREKIGWLRKILGGK